MSIDQQQIRRLKKTQSEFQDLVLQSSRHDLAQCTKLLAMYIALYKQKFGEIPAQNYHHFVADSDLDSDMALLIQDGIDEATAMLRLILDEQAGQTFTAPPSPSVH